MKIPAPYRRASIVVLVVMVSVALLVPDISEQSYGWIPLLGGLDYGTFLNNGAVSILLGIATVGAALFSLYFILRRTSAVNYASTVVILLLLLASNPSFLHFNTVYVLLLSLVWVQYCIIEREIFISFLILSAASLFYAPALWLAPFSLLLIPLSGTPDSFKSLVKAFAGFLVPHIYMVAFRWMRYDDAQVYLLQYWDCITDFHFLEHQLVLPRLFMAIYLFYLLVRASAYSLRSSASKLVQGILKMQILSVSISLPLFICFDCEASPLFPIIAFPAALLITYYFTNFGNTKRIGAELVLMLLAIIINSLSYFI